MHTTRRTERRDRASATAALGLSILLAASCLAAAAEATIVPFFNPVNASAFTSLVQLPEGRLNTDVVISTCTGLVGNRVNAWDGLYEIPPAIPTPGETNNATLVFGDELFENSVRGITFDGSRLIALISNAYIVRFQWDTNTNTLTLNTPVASSVLPSNPSFTGPLSFPSEACTSCISILGGGLPIIMSPFEAWAVLCATPPGLGQPCSGEVVLGPRVMNILHTGTNRCPDPSPTSFVPTNTNSDAINFQTGQTFGGASPQTVCLHDIMYVARRINPLDGTYRLFFQMADQRFLFEAKGFLNSGNAISLLRLSTKLIKPTPAYDARRLSAIHTCDYYIWPDVGSTDLFAINTGTSPPPVPYRITAVTTGLPLSPTHSGWLSAFGAGNSLYVSSAENDGKLLRINGAALEAAMDAEVLQFPDACANGGPCNISGGHTCVSVQGVAQCQCGPTEDSRPFGCVDLDECALGIHTCTAPASRCINTVPGFTCGCGDGFHSATMLPPCVPNNNCDPPRLRCVPPGVCSDTPVGFECVCPAPYVNDRGVCVRATADISVTLSAGTIDAAAVGTESVAIAIQSDGSPRTTPFVIEASTGNLVRSLFIDFQGAPLDITGLPVGTPLFSITGNLNAVTVRNLHIASPNDVSLFNVFNTTAIIGVIGSAISAPTSTGFFPTQAAGVFLPDTTVQFSAQTF